MRLGADEAGRGPVLGSMFVAAIRAPAEALPDTVDDSKRLSADRRESLARTLRADDRVEIAVTEVPVDRIDDPETDMNGLTAGAHAAALGEVAQDGDGAIVDACDVSEGRFGRRVAAQIEADVAVTATHGADGTEPIVSAASVLAKSAREAHVDDLSEEYGTIGSGYPSDRTTRSFLEDYVEEHGTLPDCARASWGTCETVIENAAQRALGEF